MNVNSKMKRAAVTDEITKNAKSIPGPQYIDVDMVSPIIISNYCYFNRKNTRRNKTRL